MVGVKDKTKGQIYKNAKFLRHIATFKEQMGESAEGVVELNLIRFNRAIANSSPSGKIAPMYEINRWIYDFDAGTCEPSPHGISFTHNQARKLYKVLKREFEKETQQRKQQWMQRRAKM